MSYNRIAILAELRTELVTGTCNPSRGLAELAGRLVVDETFNKTLLYKIADRRRLAVATRDEPRQPHAARDHTSPARSTTLPASPQQ